MISVHAISILSELRVLRSRLDEMIAHPHLFADIDRLNWMWNVCNGLINKVERTAEYIGSLESQVDPEGEWSSPAARLGSQQRGDDVRERGTVRPASE